MVGMTHTPQLHWKTKQKKNCCRAENGKCPCSTTNFISLILLSLCEMIYSVWNEKFNFFPAIYLISTWIEWEGFICCSHITFTVCCFSASQAYEKNETENLFFPTFSIVRLRLLYTFYPLIASIYTMHKSIFEMANEYKHLAPAFCPMKT